MVIGTLGTFLPVLPGTPLIFLAALGYGFYEGFNKITPLILLIMFMLTVLTLLIDYFAGVVGAKKFGATGYGIWGAFLGGILGVIFFSIPGLTLGPLAGAVTGELVKGRNLSDAVRSGLGTVIGIAGGSIFKVTVALSMVSIYVAIVV
ncbi:MAG: DUF456 domain-containing protein [Firmicutes bacterium HGW-Firmicutes-14]|jgi:hypothetical protein|nr:MAG: DUF456 domain-containing protein [Firmicutes bacterium HGW-Firmicutes-14]